MGRCRHSGDNRNIRSAERAERRDYYIAGTDCSFGLQSEPLCVGEYQIVLVTHAKPEQVIDIRLVYRYSEEGGCGFTGVEAG